MSPGSDTFYTTFYLHELGTVSVTSVMSTTQKKDKRTTYFTGLLWRLNKLIHECASDRHTAHRKLSVTLTHNVNSPYPFLCSSQHWRGMSSDPSEDVAEVGLIAKGHPRQKCLVMRADPKYSSIQSRDLSIHCASLWDQGLELGHWLVWWASLQQNLPSRSDSTPQGSTSNLRALSLKTFEQGL